MTILLIIVSILAGLFLDLLLAVWIPVYVFFFPIAVLVVVFWLQRLRFSERLILALITGWLFDSLFLVPFGTYLTVFFALTLIIHPLRLFFRYGPTMSYQGAFTVGLYVILLISLPFFERMLSFFLGGG